MRVVIDETPDARRYRCKLDGEDVSSRCVAADDEEGWADLLPGRDEQWRGSIVMRHRGKVELWMPE